MKISIALQISLLHGAHGYMRSPKPFVVKGGCPRLSTDHRQSFVTVKSSVALEQTEVASPGEPLKTDESSSSKDRNSFSSYVDDMINPEASLPQHVRLARLLRWSTHLEALIEAEQKRASRVGENGTDQGDGGLTGKSETVPQSAGLHSAAVHAHEALGALCLSLDDSLMQETQKKTEKKQKTRARRKNVELGLRVVTGWSIAGVCTAWIMSGNVFHALGLFALAASAQLEFFKAATVASGMDVARTSALSSTRALTIAASAAMFLAALQVDGSLHAVLLPLSIVATVAWTMLSQKHPPSISEVASCVTSMTYAGFMISFWLRLRVAVDAHFASAGIASAAVAAAGVGSFTLAPGALVMWWTSFAVVMSDVGAYFGGKKYGTTKLSAVGRGAAGVTSPNKTVQGAVAGFAASTLAGLAGALAMKWPTPWVSGPVFGFLVGVFGMFGDLTASMLKRDAGIKDFSTLFPGHGGILDRFDGYIFVGPMAYAFVTTFILPGL